MAFFIGCLFSTWIGRKIGWTISRGVLYSSSSAVCIVICLVWSIGVAYALRLSILATQPGLLLKVFGYGAGAYISVPNYGLLDESSIPESGMPRHVLIKGLPFVAFIVASIALAFGVLSAPSQAAVNKDELTPEEFSVLSSVINNRQPLQESDLNALRTMVKSYYARTKHYFTGQDVKSLTGGIVTANSYYYALAQSMLISWDSGQYQTTKDFDSLYRQMQQADLVQSAGEYGSDDLGRGGSTGVWLRLRG